MDADDLNVVSVLFMAAVVATGAVVVIRHRDTAFGLTLLWGFVGIYEASKDRGADLAVQYAALGAVALVTILCLASGTYWIDCSFTVSRRGDEQQSTFSHSLA